LLLHDYQRKAQFGRRRSREYASEPA
jgi:hypothetical protein